MQDKSLQIVSYEQAQKLKKLGFDWKLLEFFNKAEKLESKVILNCECNKCITELEDLFRNIAQGNIVSAPSIAHALKWFRDEKGIKCYVINGESNMGTYYFNDEWDGTIEYATYEEAESALLDKLIELEMSKEMADGQTHNKTNN